MRKKWDLLLIAGILITAAAIWRYFRSVRPEGAEAVVFVDGEETARYSLEESLETEISSPWGSNLLVIEEGRAKIIEADCPDKLCVNQKAIRFQGESIICLPHRVTVTIEGGQENELDGVS